MRVVIDIEANALFNPTKIWCIVCKDIDTGKYHIFRNVTHDVEENRRWLEFIPTVSLWIGHNLLGYDFGVLRRLTPCPAFTDHDRFVLRSLDTLILSKLIDYPRDGHSIEDYGLEFNYPKIKFNDFSKWSQELEDYCIRDVDICERIYRLYERYISNPDHHRSIRLEHEFQLVTNQLHDKGFCFNVPKAEGLLQKVEKELGEIDREISEAFPPRLKLIREITPKETKYGTISLSSIPKTMRGDIHELSVGASFSYCHWVDFNPSSHKQIIEILNDSKWQPVDRTKTHIDTEREYSKLKFRGGKSPEDVRRFEELRTKLNDLKTTGWRVNENNLDTLPITAPSPARLLAKRIMLEARRRTLTEWLDLTWHKIEVDITASGIVTGIKRKSLTQFGWTRKENRDENINSQTQTNSEKITKETISNIPTDCPSMTLLEWLKSNKVVVQSVEKKQSSMLITVIGQEQLENCCALIATVTSDGLRQTPLKYRIISSRIHGRFNGLGAWSHRMNHQQPNTANIPNEFDTAGKKKLLGKELRSLWMAPKNRLLVGCDAEGIQLRIFAHYINDPEFTESLVNGRKEEKTDPHSLNQRILGDVCKSRAAAKRYIYALLLGAGQGKLREILDCDERSATEAYDRLLSRYTGFAFLKETIIPRDAKRGWFVGLDGRRVRIPGDTVGNRRHLCMSGYLQNGEAVVVKRTAVLSAPRLKELNSFFVNIIHDEFQVEVPNDMGVALQVSSLLANNIRIAGEEFGLLCPMAGSYWDADHGDYTIGVNWSQTH